MFHCRENIHFLLSLNLLGNIEGDTKQSTSFCTVPEMAVIVENLILDCFLSKCKSGSSGRVGGGGEGRRAGGEKHEIYAAVFGGHLFYELFLQK